MPISLSGNVPADPSIPTACNRVLGGSLESHRSRFYRRRYWVDMPIWHFACQYSYVGRFVPLRDADRQSGWVLSDRGLFLPGREHEMVHSDSPDISYDRDDGRINHLLKLRLGKYEPGAQWRPILRAGKPRCQQSRRIDMRIRRALGGKTDLEGRNHHVDTVFCY